MKATDRLGAVALVLAGLLAVLAGGFVLIRHPGPTDLPTAAPTATPTATTTAQVSSLPRPECPVSKILVPACGRWWGVAPAALTSRDPAQALPDFEKLTDRKVDVFHAYHRDDDLFPDEHERALAEAPDSPRLLFLNWKPSTTMTWRQIADGGVDNRIDALASHITSTFSQRFFLTVWHEPENDVNDRPGSGMTAEDYRDMFRHIVVRLRNKGVENAVMVMTYIGSPSWGVMPWFPSLYPGDDVVDWIGYDPYVFATPTGRIAGDFTDLVNRQGRGWPGFYAWAQGSHASKPLIVAEWGVFASATEPARKAFVYESAEQEISNFPAIKALLYFDSPNAPKGDTRVDSSPDALQAFRRLGRQPPFVAPNVPSS